MIYRKINTALQYTFCSMELSINQLTFGIVLDGIILTPAHNMLIQARCTFMYLVYVNQPEGELHTSRYGGIP